MNPKDYSRYYDAIVILIGVCLLLGFGLLKRFFG